ncbi:MAG: hypothetical protein LBN97_00660 [Oscillospiraceae bacterium]|jgi:hypothetical protein|nr:hypothetical protein [Oscillospiraceae bacterium]
MEDKTISNELNYKEAYYYLFNNITSFITWLQELQEISEEICVGESKRSEQINIAEVLKNLTKAADAAALQ